MTDTAAHLRAAADHLDDARVEIDRAQNAATSQEFVSLIAKSEGQTEALAETLREMAHNVDVLEGEEDE